ncbi:hypothetical protein OC845_002668 [Tilletia horrida]|nr:hypothetical protein OC845_002668 [Tilletia horrida]
MLHAHPTAAFHHAHLLQGIIRILLAAPTFPSPSTLITVSAPTKAGIPDTNPSFSRASAAAVHLLSEIFRRILCKYATDAAVHSERNGRAKLSWGDVVHVLEEIGGGDAIEELLEWCVSRGTAGADQAAAEGASLQRPRIAAPIHADDDERENLEFHFTSLPKSLGDARDLLDERDREARDVATHLNSQHALHAFEGEDSDAESISDSESHWHLALLREAEREFVDEVESQEHLHTKPAPLAVKMDVDGDETPSRDDFPPQERERDAAQEAQMDLDDEADLLRADAQPETAGPEVGSSKAMNVNELPPIPQPPRSRQRRNRVPPIPIDASLSSEANSFLTPAATINGSSTDPALLHMGQQRRNVALVLSDPQRFAPSASLYAVTPPARSGSEAGGLPFVPGPSLLITLPGSGAQSAAPYFTPVHPYGRAAGGAGAPPGGSLSTQYRNNSDLFLAARTVCEPSLLRRATRTEDPAPLLDESFAERVFQGWPAEKDLLEQAALGRGLLAPAIRVLKRQKEVKRMEEGGSRKKKKKRKIGLVGPSSATAKGKGKATGGAGGSKRGGRGGAKGSARASNRPGKGKSRSIYVDDYDEDEFDEYLDDPVANGMDDEDEGGYGPRGALPTPRRGAYEDEEDDSEDEDLKPPESGMLVHTWDWQNRDYTDGALPIQRIRGRLRSGGPGSAGPVAGGSGAAEGEMAQGPEGEGGLTEATPSSATAPVDTLASAAPVPSSVNGEVATVIPSASLVQSPASVGTPAVPIAAPSSAPVSSSPSHVEFSTVDPPVPLAQLPASTKVPVDPIDVQISSESVERAQLDPSAPVPSLKSTELATDLIPTSTATAEGAAEEPPQVAKSPILVAPTPAPAMDSSQSSVRLVDVSTIPTDSSQAPAQSPIPATSNGDPVAEAASSNASIGFDDSVNVAANVPPTEEMAAEEEVSKAADKA